MGREAVPQEYVEKNKFLKWLDEALGFMCIHISRYLLFHLEGLKTLKEAWKSLNLCLENKMSSRAYSGE